MEKSAVIVLFGRKMREDADLEDYEATNSRMNELVAQVPGFISIKYYTGLDGEQFAMVRFESEEALREWRTHPEHRQAQRKGRESFYESYWVQVYRCVRDYEFPTQAFFGEAATDEMGSVRSES
jgi:heme-degrading monooxygenase HmoA